MAAAQGHGDDRRRGEGRDRLPRSGGARHRPGEQAPCLRIAGPGARHGRGERETRFQVRPAKLRRRCTDPARSRAQVHPNPDQQSHEAHRAQGVRVGDRGSGAHCRAHERGKLVVPGDEAHQDGPPAQHLMPEYTGSADGTGRRIAVVVARFNATITQKLLDGALDALTRHGVAFDDIDTLANTTNG